VYFINRRIVSIYQSLFYTYQVHLICQRPKDDPDVPPDLHLEEEFVNLEEEDTLKRGGSNNTSGSEDSEFSILGFMEKKLK
jgi:hypothetical protein